METLKATREWLGGDLRILEKRLFGGFPNSHHQCESTLADTGISQRQSVAVANNHCPGIHGFATYFEVLRYRSAVYAF